MSKFWSPIVGMLKPYTAGEQPSIANLVKLPTLREQTVNVAGS